MSDPLSLLLLGLLGLLAGTLTTLAGQGGGLVLLGALGLLYDPHTALAWTAPALLLGNLHRALLYRREVDRRTALLLLGGAAPAAFLVGLLAAGLPPLALGIALVGVGGLGLLSSTGRLRWRAPTRAVPWMGALAGALTGTGGGAGVVLGPALMARGLAGRPYVATMATVAVALHSSRLLAYGLGGVADARALQVGVGLALAITAGNLLGDRVFAGVGDRAQGRVQQVALVVSLVLAVGELWA
ncbi:TSUP family transporter [Myxococcota bacterium]|nr:TSUP family transporter [Myxococcota bacterium]